MEITIFLVILLNSISGGTLLPIWGQNLKTGLEKMISSLGLNFYLDLHLSTKIHALKTNQNKQLTTLNQVDLTFAQSYISGYISSTYFYLLQTMKRSCWEHTLGQIKNVLVSGRVACNPQIFTEKLERQIVWLNSLAESLT